MNILHVPTALHKKGKYISIKDIVTNILIAFMKIASTFANRTFSILERAITNVDIGNI